MLSSTLSPDCTRTVAPASFLKALGAENKPLSNPEYEALVRVEFPAFVSQQIEMHRLVVDEVQKSAFLHLEFHATLLGEKKYDLEFVFFLNMTESCDKVKSITQFLDTAACVEARGVIHDMLASQSC